MRGPSRSEYPRGRPRSIGPQQEATDKTVLGNFASVHFTYAGVASTFFKRDVNSSSKPMV
jgi:hypothetical protein